MINSIFLGLYSLASIMGISSGIDFEVTREDYTLIANTINSPITFNQSGEACIRNVKEYDDVYSIYGENIYLEVELKNGGYLLFNKKDNVVVEYNLLAHSPYKNYDGNLKIFHNEKEPQYLVFDETEFILLNDNTRLSKNTINNLSNNQTALSAGQYDSSIVPGQDAVLISNAFYFENLHDYHGLNDSGICAIIATQIALGYYDTFYNDTLVNDMYDKIAIEYSNTKNIKNFSQSPGTGKESGTDEDQRFRDYLIDIATQEIGVSPVNRGMFTREQIKLVKRYLNDAGFNYKLSTCEGNWLDDVTNRTKNIIKKTLDAGRPVLCSGSGHFSIAYGYDDNYVYVHTGWGWTGATPWSTFTTKWINNEFDTGAIDIQLINEHYHSDNYYSNYYNEYYCVDGFKYENAVFDPKDYGFESQYFFYEKEKAIAYDNYIIDTRRLRTGYIEEEYINLSSRRLNAGIAYLEYNCPSYIKKLKINISFWSNAEMYVSGLDKAEIQYLDTEGNWQKLFDLLDDISLSTDRENQNTIYLHFPKETSTFRIYAENDALGDRNKGRISIGRVEIMHE